MFRVLSGVMLATFFEDFFGAGTDADAGGDTVDFTGVKRKIAVKHDGRGRKTNAKSGAA